MNLRKVIIIVLCTFCLTTTIYSMFPVNSLPQSIPQRQYVPWGDLDGNGRIDLADLVTLAMHYGATGVPYSSSIPTQTSYSYDSKWLEIGQGDYLGLTINQETAKYTALVLGQQPGQRTHRFSFNGMTSLNQQYIAMYYQNLDTEHDFNGMTNGNSTIVSIIHTKDGGYAFLLNANQTYQDPDTKAIYHDSIIEVEKTDASLYLQWGGYYSNGGRCYGNSIIQTSDGGYAIAGWTDKLGRSCIYVVKIDATDPTSYSDYTFDDTHWETSGGPGGPSTQVGDFSDMVGNCIIQNTNNHWFIIVGYALEPQGKTAFELELSSSFGSHAQPTFPGSPQSEACSIVQTGPDAYIIAGDTNANGNGGYDVCLWKQLGTTSPVQWAWGPITYGVPSTDNFAYSMVQTSDGGFAITGKTTMPVPIFDERMVVERDQQTTDDTFNILLVKTDADGNLQWQRAVGAPYLYDAGLCVIQTGNDGYAIAGETAQDFARSNLQACLIKTDAEGNQQWIYYDKGPSNLNGDAWTSVVQDSTGSFILGGFFNCNSYGYDAAGQPCTPQPYIAKISNVLGIAVTYMDENTLILYRGLNDEYWPRVRVYVYAG